jgi:hypothetical protein
MANIIRTIGLSSGDVLAFTISANDLYLSADIDIEQIVNAIDSPNIRPRFRIFVLNPDESIRYQIPLEDIMDNGSCEENYQSGQRRTLSF